MTDKIKADTKSANVKVNNIKSILELDASKIGLKTVCYSCNTMFYDLGKDDPVCPSCETPYSKSMRVIKKAHVATEFFVDDDLDVLADDDTDDVEELIDTDD